MQSPIPSLLDFQTPTSNNLQSPLASEDSPNSGLLLIMWCVVGSILLAGELLKKTYCRYETSDHFWRSLEGQEPKVICPDTVLRKKDGTTTTVGTLRTEMFSACSQMSSLFIHHIEKRGLDPATVVDIGCGSGCNSAPLLPYKVHVTAIDSMQTLLNQYQQAVDPSNQQYLSTRCEDITKLAWFGENNSADLVLAIDILPYIPFAEWQMTMQKIVSVLKPGGYLFCSLFVTSAWFLTSPHIQFHEMLGARYLSIIEPVKRLVKHSGLELAQEAHQSDRYDFVAIKPIPSDWTGGSFNASPRARPMQIGPDLLSFLLASMSRQTSHGDGLQSVHFPNAVAAHLGGW